jgi:twinkle protein
MLEKLPLSISHSEHLENNRKIPCEIAAEMGVVSKGPHLAFEFRRDGVCSYLQVKREGKDEDANRTKSFHIEPKGSALFFWNDDCLNDPLAPEATLIITEGVEDALSWMVAGATHVVSVPNGTTDRPGEGDVNPSEDHRFAYLWVNGRLDPLVDRYKTLILSSDGDKAGAVLRDELALRLGRDRCWYVSYPEGCKDANDVLRKHDIDGFGALLEGARPIVPSELVQYDDIPRRGMSYLFDRLAAD